METLRQAEAELKRFAQNTMPKSQTMRGFFAAIGLGPGGIPDEETRDFMRLGADKYNARDQLGDGGRQGMMISLYSVIGFASTHMPMSELGTLKPLMELYEALKETEYGKTHPALVPRKDRPRRLLERDEIEFYSRCLVASSIHKAFHRTSRQVADAAILNRPDVRTAAQLHKSRSRIQAHAVMPKWRVGGDILEHGTTRFQILLLECGRLCESDRKNYTGIAFNTCYEDTASDSFQSAGPQSTSCQRNYSDFY